MPDAIVALLPGMSITENEYPVVARPVSLAARHITLTTAPPIAAVCRVIGLS